MVAELDLSSAVDFETEIEQELEREWCCAARYAEVAGVVEPEPACFAVEALALAGLALDLESTVATTMAVLTLAGLLSPSPFPFPSLISR